jgi:hypothetical protein
MSEQTKRNLIIVAILAAIAVWYWWPSRWVYYKQPDLLNEMVQFRKDKVTGNISFWDASLEVWEPVGNAR